MVSNSSFILSAVASIYFAKFYFSEQYIHSMSLGGAVYWGWV
jgi:hypothetical protein